MNKLNELMAEKVMGWYLIEIDGIFYWEEEDIRPKKICCSDWNPTEDIAQALMCVKRYVEYANMRFEMDILPHGYSISLKQMDDKMISGSFVGKNDSLTKAICECIAEAIGDE